MIKNESKIQDQKLEISATGGSACLRATHRQTRGGKDQRSKASSRGVVLILVLGMLSIMVMMAVAFSISMRTERVASGNYVNTVRARQLVYAGLARAMDQINSEMGTNLSRPGGLVYPNWTVTNSYTNDAGYTDGADLLKGSASNFVPRALWPAAVAATNQNPMNHWLTLEYAAGTNVAGEEVKLLAGRVAYMILNCSGLLDANFAGGLDGGVLIPREQGINPNEIAIANLSEINNANNFFSDRAEDIRYETLEELSVLNDGVSTASNLFIYSRFPAGYWTNGGGGGVSTGLNIINIEQSDAGWDTQDIINAFINAGFTGVEAGRLYTNLHDYVHIGPMPMVNEIVVENSIVAGTNISCKISIELWNPFFEDVPAGFLLEYGITFSDVFADIPNAQNALPVIPAGTFRVVTNTPPMEPLPANVDFNVSLRPRILLDGNVVNGLSADANFNMTDGDQTKSRECIDPRFNHMDTTDSDYWVSTNTHTLGAVNQAALDCLINDLEMLPEEAVMHAAGEPLKTVGELGYLAYAPWETIRLHGPDAHGVLDFFAQGTNEVFQGLVNPNTFEVGALAAVFADMPVDRYPGDNQASDLGWSDARFMAERIYNAIIVVGVYTNISDMYRAMTDFPASADTKMEKDAFVRNAAGLLGTRQNLFTIIIEAQASGGRIMPRRPARQRAVALVWRDPYTGESFVRSLKWLED